jgi:regulator of protease activity HflC (stomatin/prohibitin superfamily)
MDNAFNKRNSDPAGMIKIISAMGVALIVALIFVGGIFYTVDQGERGVLLRNGAFVSIAGPGLGFKMPIIDSVVPISVQDHIYTYEEVQAYSKDQQTGTMKVSISVQVPVGDVENLYANYGSMDNLVSRLLNPQVNKTLEEVFGHFDAVTAVQDRTRLGVEFSQAIQAAVRGPVQIKSVQIENIDFSDEYEAAIAAKTKAEVAIKTAENKAKQAEVDARVGVINAEAAAKAQIAKATADAASIQLNGEAQAKITKLNGEAEASAIKAKADALASSPNLVALTLAQNWDGKLPTAMIPGSAVPFINVNPVDPLK